MGVVTFRRTMSDDATPRDVPAEEGACMLRNEHAKPSDESALATRVPSPAQRENATTSKYRGENMAWESWIVRWCKMHCGARCIARCTTTGCVGGCVGGCGSCTAAARLGHLRRLKFAHENGCPWDEDTCLEAAWGGDLEILQYLHDNGCPWDDRACAAAAGRGYLECLQYLHEKGCAWEEFTCEAAANGGHLECLRYAHENGCPLDLATVKELLEDGWVWDDETSYIAATAGHLECLQYLLAVERGDHQIQALNNNEMEIATTMVDMKSSAHVAGTTLQWGTRKARTTLVRMWQVRMAKTCRPGERVCGVRWDMECICDTILYGKKSLELEPRKDCLTTPGDASTERQEKYRIWTQEEEDALRAGVNKHGRRWEAVKNDPTFSQILKNRSLKGMTDKWCYIEKREGKRTPPRVYRRWTQEEEDALRAGVGKHGRRWEGIQNDPTFSQILKTRSPKDMSKRWCDMEKREGKRTTTRVFRRWTQEEEDALCAGIDKHGNRWERIKNDPTFSQILKNRSPRDMAGKRRYL